MEVLERVTDVPYSSGKVQVNLVKITALKKMSFRE